MITKISDKGITFIKDFEGIKLKTYRDVKACHRNHAQCITGSDHRHKAQKEEEVAAPC